MPALDSGIFFKMLLYFGNSNLATKKLNTNIFNRQSAFPVTTVPLVGSSLGTKHLLTCHNDAWWEDVGLQRLKVNPLIEKIV